MMNLFQSHSIRPRSVPLATRTLLRDPLRLAIGVGGIAVAILLVLMLDGLRVGTVKKSTIYIDNVGAQVVVGQEGVDNMALAASGLPETIEQDIAQVAGVAHASGILRIPMIVAVEGDKRPVTVIGYDPALELGGPWSLDSGRNLTVDSETVIDDTLADAFGLRLGDDVEVAGLRFTVVGTSRETANIAGKHVFVTRHTTQEALGLSGLVNFVLVQVEAGQEPHAVADRLNEQVPGITATTVQEMSENDQELLGSLFLAPIAVASTVGLLVGLAIIGLTMYTTTAERIRDFGVLKAMGARDAYLLRTVVTQAAVFGLLGFLLGLGFSYLAGPFIVRLVPDIGVEIETRHALITLGEVVVMSLLGAVIPVIRILRVDPLMVFRN
jgi:putative ABC transport system permease protein